MLRRKIHPKKYLRKLFHKGGHNVHSPFAYKLLTAVVEEKAYYYKYHSLKQDLKKTRSKIHLPELRFLYRLAVHYPISSIRYYGENSHLEEILKDFPQNHPYPQQHCYGPFREQDCFELIVIENPNYLPPKFTIPPFAFIYSFKSKRNKKWIQALFQDLERGALFDLFYAYLLVHSDNLHKQIYKSIL